MRTLWQLQQDQPHPEPLSRSGRFPAPRVERLKAQQISSARGVRALCQHHAGSTAIFSTAWVTVAALKEKKASLAQKPSPARNDVSLDLPVLVSKCRRSRRRVGLEQRTLPRVAATGWEAGTLKSSNKYFSLLTSLRRSSWSDFSIQTPGGSPTRCQRWSVSVTFARRCLSLSTIRPPCPLDSRCAAHFISFLPSCIRQRRF